MHARPSGQCGVAGDEARAALVGHVRPEPLDENQQAIAEANQEENVNEEPGKPGDEAGDVNFAELRDGGVAADGGQRTLVPVVEGFTRLVREITANRPGDVLAGRARP